MNNKSDKNFDIIKIIKWLKWKYAGHISRRQDDDEYNHSIVLSQKSKVTNKTTSSEMEFRNSKMAGVSWVTK